ncbi:MAG: hypothetical protein WBB45_16950 [Cyclobacteriaceae bacterium]
MKSEFKVAGIDFGSKLSGFTVIAWIDSDSLVVKWMQSEKKRSADDFLQKTISSFGPYIIGIDAPLSLPGIYRWPGEYEDYFYRIADRMAAAMSPMFIGGLTARAIKLAHQLRQAGIQVEEVYPKLLAAEWKLSRSGYRKNDGNIALALEMIKKQTGWVLPDTKATWHHVDALLALASAVRIQNGTAATMGDEKEGMIYY